MVMIDDELRERIVPAIECGMIWLTSSDIYCKNGKETGGLKSKYDPKTKKYEVWAGGTTDALSTAGFIETSLLYGQIFDKNTFDSEIKISIKHLINLWNNDERIMFAGLNSKYVYPLWASQTANALYLNLEINEDANSKEAANRLVNWLISIQNKDGSLPRNQIWDGTIKKSPVSSWNTWAITTFLTAHKHGVPNALNSADKLANWMISNQEKDGSYCYNFGSVNSIWRNIRDVKKNGYMGMLSSKTLWKHPTSQTHSYFAALKYYQQTKDKKYLDSALKARQWTYDNLSPRKIMYEKYWVKETSIQEDVYPTAILMLGDYELFNETGDKKYLDSSIEIARIFMDCQLFSEDPNLNGSFPGVPLHPIEGHKAYTWDTVGVLKALIELYRILNIEKDTLEIT